MSLFSSSHPRTSVVKKNIIGSLGVKVITIATSLLLVPLTIGYISSELYGIWLTLTSIISWASFFDIGFGNGLRNKLATAISLQDYERGKTYVSTTYFFMFLIFSVLGICLYFIVPLINWSSFLNVSNGLNSQLINVMRIVILFFVLQMVLNILTTIMTANLQNAKASFINALGQILSLSFIFILTKTTFPSLNYLAIALSGSPVIVLLLASILFYRGSYSQLSPSLKYIRAKYAKDILQLGGKFFIIQIAALILYQTTNIIISRVAGPESVTIYNVAYKYLGVSMMVFNIIMTPIWSAFTDAYTKLDYNWMNNIYHKLLKIYYFSMITLFAMLAISPIIYKLWLGDKVNVPFSMSLIIAIYMGCNIWNSIHSMIINGVGKIKLQLYLSLLATIFNIPLSLYLGKLLGAEGVILSMIFFSILPAIFLAVQTRKILREQAIGIWNK